MSAVIAWNPLPEASKPAFAALIFVSNALLVSYFLYHSFWSPTPEAVKDVHYQWIILFVFIFVANVWNFKRNVPDYAQEEHV